MADHQKPTREELEEKIKASLQALETPPDPTPTPEPVKEEPETPPEEKKDDIVVEPKEEEPKKEEEKADDKSAEDQDINKRYLESTREAQILYARNKKMEETVEEAAILPEPTEDELKVEATKKGLTYDEMTASERVLFKDNLHNARKLEKITQVSKESKDIEAWHGKVDSFINDPKTLSDNPLLEGKETDFKLYATRPTKRGVDFETLVAAFLFDDAKSRPKHKGAMFPNGSGGPNDKAKPKSDKISLTEARTLMKTDYNKYKQYLKDGKIDLSSI